VVGDRSFQTNLRKIWRQSGGSERCSEEGASAAGPLRGPKQPQLHKPADYRPVLTLLAVLTCGLLLQIFYVVISGDREIVAANGVGASMSGQPFDKNKDRLVWRPRPLI
jgi:hypothetical protein